MLKRYIAGVLCLMMLICCARAESLLDTWEKIARIPDSEGLYLVYGNEKWGVASRDGAVIIEPRFHREPEFKNGYAVVAVLDAYAENDLSGESEYGSAYGVIDALGNFILPAEYDSIEISADGDILLVEKNDKYGFMDMQGNFIIDMEYDRAHMFTGEYAAVAKHYDLGDDNRDSMGYTTCWGMIDRSGKTCIPLDYDWLETSKNGIAAVQLNGEYAYINHKNETIVDFEYFSAGPYVDGYAAVAVQENINGTSGDSYKDIQSSWGVIDENGKEVIPCRYHSLQMGDNGLALVQENSGGDYSFINMQGETIIDGLFRAEPFIGGIAAVGRKYTVPDGSSDFSVLWGAVDSAGNEILPMEYDSIQIHPDGTIEARLNGAKEGYTVSGGRAVRMEE